MSDVKATEKRWSDMTPEERDALPEGERTKLYHRDYHERMRPVRREARRKRWQKDDEYRAHQLQLMRDNRAKKRARKATAKLKAAIASKANSATRFRHPRLADVGGERKLVYSTGVFAQSVGREINTVRAWIDEGALPGCSIVIGGRCWFTEKFTHLVVTALARLLRADARMPRTLLRQFVTEALNTAGEPFVPAPQRSIKNGGP